MASLAGSFLVAKTMLNDSLFNQTVVLLLQHNDGGAFGLVVNRPAKAKGVPYPVYTGGPCPSEGLILLHGHPDWKPPPDASDNEVAPGIFVGDAECLERVSDPTPGEEFRFRVFVGYSGWGPNQLEGELASGAWSVVNATGELLFDTPPDELWDLLVPPPLPQPSLN